MCVCVWLIRFIRTDFSPLYDFNVSRISRYKCPRKVLCHRIVRPRGSASPCLMVHEWFARYTISSCLFMSIQREKHHTVSIRFLYVEQRYIVEGHSAEPMPRPSSIFSSQSNASLGHIERRDLNNLFIPLYVNNK